MNESNLLPPSAAAAKGLRNQLKGPIACGSVTQSQASHISEAYFQALSQASHISEAHFEALSQASHISEARFDFLMPPYVCGGGLR